MEDEKKRLLDLFTHFHYAVFEFHFPLLKNPSAVRERFYFIVMENRLRNARINLLENYLLARGGVENRGRNNIILMSKFLNNTMMSILDMSRSNTLQDGIIEIHGGSSSLSGGIDYKKACLSV
jgi:hypothetical protein